MSDRPSHLQNLPRMRGDSMMMFLVRELGHITFVIRRPDGSDEAVFTLHRAEAGSLAKRLQELIAGPDGKHTLVEACIRAARPREISSCRPSEQLALTARLRSALVASR